MALIALKIILDSNISSERFHVVARPWLEFQSALGLSGARLGAFENKRDPGLCRYSRRREKTVSRIGGAAAAGGGRSRGGIRLEAGFVWPLSPLLAVGVALARVGQQNAETFSSNCTTGVRLSVCLLLFVYYNLDTIISVSPSRRYHRPSLPFFFFFFLMAAFRHRSVSLFRPILHLSFSLPLSPPRPSVGSLPRSTRGTRHGTSNQDARERRRKSERENTA